MTESDNRKQDLTAVILAGGMARRMGGQNKGLIELNGRPLIEYIIDALQPQVDHIVISANRNLQEYRRYSYPVVTDIIGGYLGPLFGMASGLKTCDSDLILTVPCDSPFVPPVLASRLGAAMIDNPIDITVAKDNERIQPVFAMIRRSTLPGLLAYLKNGGRKIETWYTEHPMVLVDFSDWPDAFININTPEDKIAVEQKIAGG